MTDAEQPFLSRRERREAERAISGGADDFVAEQSLIDAPLSDVAAVAASNVAEHQGGIPSRKELRRLARETGVIPMLTAEMLDAAEAGTLDIEDEIRHHTGAVPTLPADVVVGVDDSYTDSNPAAYPTSSVTPISHTDNLGAAMPQWPSGSVPAIDDEVKKMEERALTGDLTAVAEELARQNEQTLPPAADPIAAAWSQPGETPTLGRTVSFDDIIAPTVPATPAPVMNVDVELPVAVAPVVEPYVETEPANISAPITPIPVVEPVAVVVPEPIVIPTPVIEPEPVGVAVPEPIVIPTPVIEPEPVAVIVPEPIVVPTPVIEPEPVVIVAPEPVVEPEPIMEVPAASPEIPPAREGDWREQLETDNEHEWVKNHETGIGVMQSPTLQTLVVDSYHTGDIAGPINPTGEILITGQILLDPMIDDEPAVEAIDAGIDVNQPGIPRRASEALSIIGKPTDVVERKRIPSVGSAVGAGLAAFLGITVVALGLLAYFTDIL